METPEELGLSDISFALKPGIYVLTLQGEVVYVGRSMRPIARVGDHSREMTFDGAWVINCEGRDMADMEAYLINKYKPRHNVLFPYQIKDNQKPLPKSGSSPRYAMHRSERALSPSKEEHFVRYAHKVDGTIESSEESSIAEIMDSIRIAPHRSVETARRMKLATKAELLAQEFINEGKSLEIEFFPRAVREITATEVKPGKFPRRA